jgi:hypothetical protein
LKEGKGGKRMVCLPLWASLRKGEKKNVFLFGGLFAKGLLKKGWSSFLKNQKYWKYWKKIWLFPIIYCDAIKPWQLGFQNIITSMMQGIIECA